MKIGIISDTHDYLPGIKKAIEIFKEQKVEMIIHCGDWVSPFALDFFLENTKNLNIPFKTIWGNNEGDFKRFIQRNAKSDNPFEYATDQTIEITVEERKIVVYHGQDKVVLNALIKCQLYDAVFTGHTHTPKKDSEGKTLVLNPGSPSYTAESQTIKKASIAIYDPSSNEAEIIYFK